MLFQWVKKLDNLVHFDSVSGREQRGNIESSGSSWLDIRQQATTTMILGSSEPAGQSKAAL